MLVRWRTVRGRGGDLPIRGLAFAAMLAAVSIPSFGLVFVLSRQLTHFTTLATGAGLPGGGVAPPPFAPAGLPEDHELLLPSFAMLLGVLAAGVIVSDSLGRGIQRQFDAPMQPLRRATAGGLPRLPAAGIRELNELIQAINDRGNQVATLADSLQTARAQLEQTAYDLTENIPVGTYTMVQPPDGGMARFEFMSTRFLDLSGLVQVKQVLRRHGVSAEHLAGGPGCVVMGDDVQLQTIVTKSRPQRRRGDRPGFQPAAGGAYRVPQPRRRCGTRRRRQRPGLARRDDRGGAAGIDEASGDGNRSVRRHDGRREPSRHGHRRPLAPGRRRVSDRVSRGAGRPGARHADRRRRRAIAAAATARPASVGPAGSGTIAMICGR